MKQEKTKPVPFHANILEKGLKKASNLLSDKYSPLIDKYVTETKIFKFLNL